MTSPKDKTEKVIKFSQQSSEEQEKIAEHQVRLLDIGGMSDDYDAQWVARQLCDWAADLIKEGKAFPTALAQWMADGLNSASNGKSLEAALKLKKGKGRKYNIDDIYQTKFEVAILVVKKGMTFDEAVLTIAEKTNRAEETIRSIIKNKKIGWHFPTLKKALSQGG